MKRIGIMLALAMFCTFALWAQDSTTQSTTTTDQNKAAAQQDANAADQEKADAKNEGTKSGEERDKVLARMDDSSKILNE
jgi:hypothetical protein